MGWLTDQRSALARATLKAAGIDVPPISPTAFSSKPIAASGPLTAFGALAWIGSTLSTGVNVHALSNRIGETQAFPAESRTSRDETTIGNLHTVVTTTMKLTSAVSGSTVTGDADVTQESTTSDTRFGTVVATSSHRSHTHVELKVCPDANGAVVLKSQVDLSSDTGGALGHVASEQHSTGERRGLVGDDAYLQSETHTQDMRYGTTSANGTSRTGSGTVSMTTGNAPGSGRVDRVVSSSRTVGAGSMSPEESVRWQALLQLTATTLTALAFDKAQELWRGGKCVRIEATEQSRSVQLNERVPFTARPVHIIDGGDLNKPIVATFTGKQSASPLDVKQNPPAQLTYTAAGTARESGVVTLTSTSNRGIGKLVLTFRTDDPSYHIDASQPGGRLKGDKCGGINGEWIADGTYQIAGTKGVQKWVIQVDRDTMAGTYTYTDDQEGRPGGSPVTIYVTGRASGTVTLVLDPDGRAKMHLKETSHTITARTDGGGVGQELGAPLSEFDLTWEVGAAC